MVTRVASRLETRTRAGDDIPMRHGLTHGLPFLLAYACALPAVGCTAAPAAGGAGGRAISRVSRSAAR